MKVKAANMASRDKSNLLTINLAIYFDNAKLRLKKFPHNPILAVFQKWRWRKRGDVVGIVTGSPHATSEINIVRIP